MCFVKLPRGWRAITHENSVKRLWRRWTRTQSSEQLGVELEARTGHKAVQHVKIRRGGTTMMMGTGQGIQEEKKRMKPSIDTRSNGCKA